jgi:hypothetical protein
MTRTVVEKTLRHESRRGPGPVALLTSPGLACGSSIIHPKESFNV